MFSSTLSGRISAFSQSPVMQVSIRWLVGMVYVFYSASFVILLREVLRPGVLWFLRNLNDPDFNPIQEVRFFLHIVLDIFFTIIFADDRSTSIPPYPTHCCVDIFIFFNHFPDCIFTAEYYSSSLSWNLAV